jgi:hypothetical protein
MNVTKYLAAAAAVCVAGGIAWGAGVFQTYPIIGGAAYCNSSVVIGNAQGGPTGQGGGVAGAGVTTGTVICGSTTPAGPALLSGTEVFPVDLYTPGTAQIAGGPATALLPVMGAGAGNITVLTTTGTTASVAAANSTNHLVYAGAGTATWTTFALPANPVNNQVFCLSDAGTGILTISAVTSGSNSIVGVTPTSLPVATAVGTAGTVTLSENCWMFQLSNTSWYRIL